MGGGTRPDGLDLDTPIRIERAVAIGDDVYGTSDDVTWEAVGDDVWARWWDVLPARAETSGGGIDMSRRPVDILMRWRDDIDGKMRIIGRGRTLRIISGPTMIGRCKWLQLRAEEYSTSGSAA